MDSGERIGEDAEKVLARKNDLVVVAKKRLLPLGREKILGPWILLTDTTC
jgi:hypothetical protein